MAVFTDDFPLATTYWCGHCFGAVEHARWAIFLGSLGFDWRYRPRRIHFEKPTPGCYKPGVVGFWYEPCFWVSKLNAWLHITDGRPLPATLEGAGLLAEQSGFPVAVIRGPMQMPDRYLIPHSVPVTMVHGEGDARIEDRFFIQRGLRIEIDRAHCLDELCAPKLIEAFQEALGFAPDSGRSRRRIAVVRAR